MANQYLQYAQDAVDVLTSRWFTPSTPRRWVPRDYWRTPTICEELVNHMRVTGEPTYMSTVENARIACQPWIGHCAYYDDETCWGRLFVATHSYLTDGGSGADPQSYLDGAIAIFDDLAQAWGPPCNGIWWKRVPHQRYLGEAAAIVNDLVQTLGPSDDVWWKRFPQKYLNNTQATNSTIGLMEIAIGLYSATRQPRYLEWTERAWDWLQRHGMIVNGLVWGGLTKTCQVDPNNKPVIALQGNPLGPLWSLYMVTGDTSLLDVAQSIADTTLAQMVWPGTRIFKADADAEWNQQTPKWREQMSGQTPFKGIFAGYLGTFAKNLATVDDPARQQAAATYVAALRSNADALRANFSDNVYGMDWHTPQPRYQPDPDDVINASLQYSALSAFLGAAKNSQSAAVGSRGISTAFTERSPTTEPRPAPT
jgi:hypothetical protein